MVDENIWLMPENPEFQPVQIKEGIELHIWGVVAHV
jgi:DNA polymerase V